MNNELYKSKNKNEISYLVNARQKTNLRTTEIYLPNTPYEKLQEGYELADKPKSTGTPIPTSEEDKLERSVRRARTAIKDLALSNDFALFANFTFASDRYDDELTRKKMMGWLKRRRKQDKSFQYLIVSELHKRCEECVGLHVNPCIHDDRPKAIHFHALIAGYGSELVRAINPHTSKPIVKKRRKVYDFPNFTLGNSEVYIIGDTDQDKIRSSFYLLKYLRKETPTFKSKKRYWASRGLKRPFTIDNPEEWFFDITPDHFIEAPHGKYLFFDNKRIQIFLP